MKQGSVEDVYAEEEVKKFGEEFQILFNIMPDPVLIVDGKGNFLAVSDKVEEKTKFKREELLGKNFLKTKLVTAKDKALLVKNLAKVMMGIEIAPYEIEVLTKDGKKILAEGTAYKIEYMGKPAVISVFRDITERKRFEEKLSALNIYGRSLNTAESTEQIYRLTLDAMEKTLGFEIGAFMVADKDMLYVADQRGYPESFSVRLPLNGTKRGISVRTARTGRSILIPDAEKEDEWVEFLVGGRSGICVPVKIGRKVLGVLVIESRRLNAFDEKDQKLLEILASHAATAMSNLKYAKNLEAYAREIRESQEKFERLFMDNPEAAVYLSPEFRILDVNPRFEELFGHSLYEIKGKLLDDIVVPKDKLEEAEMLNIKAGKGYVYHETVRKRKDKSLVPVSVSAAPITIEGQLMGYVGLYKDITARKKTEEALRKAEERARALNIYSRNLNMANRMEQIYQLTLDAMEKTLGFEQASFMIADKNMLYIMDQRGYPEIHSLKLPLNGTKGGITVKAAKTRKPVLVPDTKKERAYVEGMPGIRSELAVPIKIGDRVLGVLNVESKGLDAFDEKDQKLLEILASHAATAISNLEYAKNLEKLVQERTRELKEAEEQLLKSERLAAIGQVAAMVGHDLRNPLQSIENATYYLNSELPCLFSHDSIAQKTMKMLQVLNDSVNYADKIIRDLQDFSATKKPMFKKTDINAVVKEIMSKVEAPENVELIVELGHLPQIEADRDMIKRVFLNLAVNGIQAMENGGTLKVSTNKTNGFVEVRFKDTGIGIPREEMEKIFTPLFTTKAKGMGMGLPICKKLVDAHRGNIEVESIGGKGSTFTVKLPIQQESGGEKA